MQMGFYFDQTRCCGCHTCIVACKDWNDVSAGPASWRRVITIEKGTFPDLFVVFLSTSCHHCAHPSCMEVCPVGAISKRGEDGVVVVDPDICLGKDACAQCLDACPYDAPQFEGEDAKMQKCHFCLDRLEAHQKPACVDACLMRALDAGPLDRLISLYGDGKQAEGHIYHDGLRASTVFKIKRDTKDLAVVHFN